MKKLGAMVALMAGLITGEAQAQSDLIVEKKTFEMPRYVTVGGAEIRNVRIGWESYGEPNAATWAAIRLLAGHEGVLLDPVYTGKAFAGLLDGIARQAFDPGPLLFLHTGGAPALFAYPPG